MAEEVFARDFEKLRDNMRVAHNLAMTNHGRSFLTLA